jgi:hypothetical protein
MKNIYVMIVLLSSVSTAPAAEEYYVVRDVSTKKCEIVETPPTSNGLVLVENGKVYFTREEADQVRVSGSECRSETASRIATLSASARSTSGQTNVAATGKRKARTASKKPSNVPPRANEHQANPAIMAQRDPLSSFLSLFR